MKTFIAIFRLESRQLMKKKIIGPYLFQLLLSLYFVQMGLNNYNSIIENKEKFQDFERLKVQQYFTYGQFGTYGFRVLFEPSPLSVFFINSTPISELTANVDSGERLKIYNSFKGKALFMEKSGGFKDFSGVMLLLGSLLLLYIGYESLMHKDYLRIMTGVFKPGKLFMSIVVSRVFVIILFFFLQVVAALALLHINGIRLGKSEYLFMAVYLGVQVGVAIFFFSLGTVAGTFKSRFAGFIMLLTVWFALVFLLPGVVNTITYKKAESITS
ncbi:MAG: hypothetical protein GY765_27150, partial [bacterium]|nr:hypothetical protein [bacterium]